MVVDVYFCKEEGKPFGFRLIGGADFDLPLTCSRVSEWIFYLALSLSMCKFRQVILRQSMILSTNCAKN